MKVKTSELTGAALDWATCVAGGTPGLHVVNKPGKVCVYSTLQMPSGDLLEWLVQPSTDWSQGGPIIERQIGNLWKHNKLDTNEPDVWTAAAYLKAPDGTMLYHEDGPTPLIAAMRCYVASKLGNEIDIPEELSIIPSLQNPQSN